MCFVPQQRASQIHYTIATRVFMHLIDVARIHDAESEQEHVDEEVKHDKGMCLHVLQSIRFVLHADRLDCLNNVPKYPCIEQRDIESVLRQGQTAEGIGVLRTGSKPTGDQVNLDSLQRTQSEYMKQIETCL